jgi:RNA polymerase sigma-70 factor (ECF subfamily)
MAATSQPIANRITGSRRAARAETRRSVRDKNSLAQPSTSEFAALITRIARRDDAALAELYDLTSAKLYGLARAVLGSSADAEEIVCDVYVQVWQTAASFDSARGSVLAWLLVICRSRALDLLRQRRVRGELVTQSAMADEGSLVNSPEDVLRQFQEGTAVHRAMAALTPLRRQLVALAFFKGFSHQEIAQAVDLPIGTVKSHLRRSLQSLRNALDP